MSTTPATIQQPSLPSVSQLLSSSVPNHLLGLPRPPKLITKSWAAPNLQSHRMAEEQESGTSFPTTGLPQQPPGGNRRTQVLKKFVDPRSGATSKHLVPRGPQDTPPSTSSPNMSVEPLPPPYLDFPVPPTPVLGLIGMSPSIPERKKVHTWSIILSGISNAERRACILVSRTFRYAGKSALRSLYLGCLTSTLR